MALTKAFKATVQHRAEHDPQFRQALFSEAINELLSGDVDVGKLLLRDYINATISFDTLAEMLDKNSKSLQRMLGPNGNPTSRSLFAMLHTLQQVEGIRLRAEIQ